MFLSWEGITWAKNVLATIPKSNKQSISKFTSLQEGNMHKQPLGFKLSTNKL